MRRLSARLSILDTLITGNSPHGSMRSGHLNLATPISSRNRWVSVRSGACAPGLGTTNAEVVDAALEEDAHGVTVFSPEGGQRMGLAGLVDSVVRDCGFDLWDGKPAEVSVVLAGDRFAVARAITGAELGKLPAESLIRLRAAVAARTMPVLGITGTGGSGKSSLTDELVRRFRVDQQDKLRIAVIAVDPIRRRGGGAELLGDRIRMNSLDDSRVSMTINGPAPEEAAELRPVRRPTSRSGASSRRSATSTRCPRRGCGRAAAEVDTPAVVLACCGLRATPA